MKRTSSKFTKCLLFCLLGALFVQTTLGDEYTELTGERVAKAMSEEGGKEDFKLAEGSLTALGWFVLYGKGEGSAALAEKLNTIVSDAYNGTEKMDTVYMNHTSDAYFEILNLSRFEGQPSSPSDDYAALTRKRVEDAMKEGAGDNEIKLAEGSLCALGWFVLNGNTEESLASAKEMMNKAFKLWPGGNEVYMLQSSTAYAEMINLDRFKAGAAEEPGGDGEDLPHGIAGAVQIRTPRPCLITIISSEEAAGKEYGWYSVWDARKTTGALAVSAGGDSSVDFVVMSPGKYTVVVFDPASEGYDPNNGNEDERSDGIVLENVTINQGDKKVFNLTRGDFKEWNCLSCPWLYVHDGNGYIKTTEVLRDVFGIEKKTTTSFTLPASSVIDGTIRIRLQEEKDEVTHLDRCVVRVGGLTVYPEVQDLAIAEDLKVEDADCVILEKGDRLDLRFTLPKGMANGELPIALETTGHYIPSRVFIDSHIGNNLENQANETP